MLVGFPPFHCVDKKSLYKRIMTGSLRFPPNMDEESIDLVSWLLSKVPEDRPTDFSEIKKHPFFKDIHWGRIAKKEAVPPWIPDLYQFHGPKHASLNQVFHKNTHFKDLNRTSQDENKKNSGEDFKSNIPVQEHRSNRQRNEETDLIESSASPKLFLKGKRQFL